MIKKNEFSDHCSYNPQIQCVAKTIMYLRQYLTRYFLRLSTGMLGIIIKTLFRQHGFSVTFILCRYFITTSELLHLTSTTTSVITE